LLPPPSIRFSRAYDFRSHPPFGGSDEEDGHCRNAFAPVRRNAGAAPAVPLGLYSVQEDVPETGSNISKRTVYWSFREKRYAELTSEERNIVRDDYLRMGARDEPPYPSEGMTSILLDLARIQRTNRGPGCCTSRCASMRAASRRGWPSSAHRPRHRHGVSYALMKTRYKPALCDGAPCAGDYSFKYKVQVGYSHNFIADWNTNLGWLKMKGN
jgi:hypothetical protein